MRVLVAGATGNLGRALIPVLHGRGSEVIALARPSSESRLSSLADCIEKVVTAEVTESEIPQRVFDGVHTAVSCIGITRQRDGLTYDDVDYAGNLNLLRTAEAAGVRRFVYVSVVGADKDVVVPGIRAKHRFEATLMESRLEWQLIRPSGFFTDMIEVWEMARKGTVHLFGDGRSMITPIHPTDLAETILELLGADPRAIHTIGGPDDYTWNEVAELSFRIVGRPCKIRHWPVWLLRATLGITRRLSRQTYGALSFMGYVMTNDTTAPHHGTRGLEDYLKEQQDAV